MLLRGRAQLLGDIPAIMACPSVPCTESEEDPKGRKDIIGWFEGLAAKARAAGSPLFRVQAFSRFVPGLSRNFVILLDPRHVKDLLSVPRFGQFAKGSSYDRASPLIGAGLLSSPDSEGWRAQRKAANGGFKPAMMRKAVGHAMDTVLALCSRWDAAPAAASGDAGRGAGSGGAGAKGGRADGGGAGGGAGVAPSGRGSYTASVYDEMLRLTVDVLGKVAFSHDFGKRREPFNSTPMGVNSSSSGSPHVRPMGVHRTCGEPLAKSRKIPTRKMLPLLFVIRERGVPDPRVGPRLLRV